jgi:hypothetical protein
MKHDGELPKGHVPCTDEEPTIESWNTGDKNAEYMSQLSCLQLREIRHPSVSRAGASHFHIVAKFWTTRGTLSFFPAIPL